MFAKVNVPVLGIVENMSLHICSQCGHEEAIFGSGGGVAMAEAFTTSGCPGRNCRVACNRPFGNERPSRPFRNFPLRPEQEDVALVRQQLWEGLR